MTNSDTPWEPPLAGTGVERIVGALDQLVDLLRAAVDGRVGEDPPAGWRARAISN
jgi:hypothetical protein